MNIMPYMKGKLLSLSTHVFNYREQNNTYGLEMMI